ncbi:MAG: urease accessory protein UreD, partial [Pseudomonadota bacterium]
WLPQETILYDGAALSRTTRAEIAEDAELVLLDLLVLGRIAMGEEVRRLTLTDRREVWRGARPVLIDPVALTAGDLARPDPSGLAGARAVGALHLIAADAEDRLARLRNLLPGDGSAAASAWDGRLSARFLARDPAALRAVLARALPGLTGRPLPRVWPR